MPTLSDYLQSTGMAGGRQVIAPDVQFEQHGGYPIDWYRLYAQQQNPFVRQAIGEQLAQKEAIQPAHGLIDFLHYLATGGIQDFR
jgi:hypothetical protein